MSMLTMKINNAEEKKKYDAFEETIEINMKKCNHSKVVFVGGELRCPCGSAWQGTRLAELYKYFTKNGNN